MANTLISFHDLVKHKCKNDCWILINGKVYDVSSFMDEHPGGDNMLLSVTGKDASSDFEDVGHSEDAKELMKKFCIGNVDQSTVPVTKEYIPPWEEKDSTAATAVKTTKEESGTNKMAFLIPLLILGIAFFYRFYYNNK